MRGTGKFNQMTFFALRGGRFGDGLEEDAGVTLRLQRLPFETRRKTPRKKSVPKGIKEEKTPEYISGFSVKKQKI